MNARSDLLSDSIGLSIYCCIKFNLTRLVHPEDVTGERGTHVLAFCGPRLPPELLLPFFLQVRRRAEWRRRRRRWWCWCEKWCPGLSTSYRRPHLFLTGTTFVLAFAAASVLTLLGLALASPPLLPVHLSHCLLESVAPGVRSMMVAAWRYSWGTIP